MKQEVYIKCICCIQKSCVYLNEKLLVWLSGNWTSTFFQGTSFLLEKNVQQTNWGYSDLGIWQTFLENKLFQGKQLEVPLAKSKIWVFKQKLNLEIWICHLELGIDSLLILKTFLMKSVVTLTNLGFFWYSEEMCKHLKYMYNSGNQYFSNDW